MGDNEEEEEQPELDEELYDKLMTSIQSLWVDFDIENGLIDQKQFKEIMTQVASDQGLYQGNE